MGSYNTTCAFSKAPILDNDLVRMCFIVSRERLSTTVPRDYTEHKNKMPMRGQETGISCNFQLLGFPFLATYKDYGNYDWDENDPIVKYNMSIINSGYKPIPKPDNERFGDYFDIPSSDFNPELLSGMIREGMLYFSTPYGKQFIQFFPVLETVYQTIMQSQVRTWHRNSYTYVNYEPYLEGMKDERASQIKLTQVAYENLMKQYQDDIGSIVESTGKVITHEQVQRMAHYESQMDYESHSEHLFGFSFGKSSMLSYYNRLNPDSTEEDKDFIYENQIESLFYSLVLEQYQVPFAPAITSGQRQERFDHAAMMIRVGQELYKEALQEQHEFAVIQSITEPVATIKIEDMNYYFDEHWDEEVKENGFKAITQFHKLFGKEPTVLSYNAAKALGIEALFDVLTTQHLSIKIIE